VSGHSKWSTIKHKKGAADAKRGQLFSKLSRAIMVAAKEGGPDPAANIALQNAIEKARSYSMPKDNIERAIAKGAGEGTDGSGFETVVYEGYGQEGVDDVERDGSTFVVSAAPEELARVRAALEEAGFSLESAGLSMVPKTTVAIGDESTAKQVMRLVEGLEENDDVQDVYANFDIPEAVLEAVAS
jgi:transcriptional/translational regulatory protein YebC/TACO1